MKNEIIKLKPTTNQFKKDTEVVTIEIDSGRHIRIHRETADYHTEGNTWVTEEKVVTQVWTEVGGHWAKESETIHHSNDRKVFQKPANK